MIYTNMSFYLLLISAVFGLVISGHLLTYRGLVKIDLEKDAGRPSFWQHLKV